MTIRKKVLIGLALILAMFVGLSAFTFNRIGLMARHWSGLTEVVIPTLTLSEQMSLVLERLRVLESYHVLQQDEEGMRALRIDIEKQQARLIMLMFEYRQLATDAEQLAWLDQLVSQIREYIQAFEAVRALSEVGKTEHAFELLKSSQPTYRKLAAAILGLDEHSRMHADRAGDAGMAVADQAKRGAIISVGLLTAIMLALILYSSRTILWPMQKLIHTIDMLSEGDLSTQVPYGKRLDELGDVARALEHFRQNAVEKERLQKQEQDDLAFARRVQLASVPNRFPAFPGRKEFDVAGRLAPTRAVGGDFFDFYFIGSRYLAIAIGDASGKGIASAMFVGVARSALKAESNRSTDPALWLREANRLIASDNETMMFMTTFYGILDLETGDLTYANAGHLPPYLLHGKASVGPLDADPGVPLGVLTEFDYPSRQVRLQPGDVVVLYTDGVTEAADAGNELFGDQRLVEALATCGEGSCEQIVESLFATVRLFVAGAPQADDIAVLVVRYNGTKASTVRIAEVASLPH